MQRFGALTSRPTWLVIFALLALLLCALLMPEMAMAAMGGCAAIGIAVWRRHRMQRAYASVSRPVVRASAFKLRTTLGVRPPGPLPLRT